VPPILADDVRALLDASRIAHLATADNRLRPHVVPLCYAREDDRLYFIVDEKPKRAGKRLKRLSNIAENPLVALLVDVYDEDWRKLEFVLVSGTAEIVAQAEEFRRAVALLRERYPQYRAMRLEEGRNEVVRITATGVHHWRASGSG
jgi:PPOX class probable F420-dependent enzyme